MAERSLPPRATRPSTLTFVVVVTLGAVLIASMTQVAPSPTQLIEGGPRIASLVERMMPPNLDPGFLTRAGWRVLETLQIALVGAAIGIALSLPIAWLAARGASPLGPGLWIVRALISLMRTIPDLVWALIFVSAVGLGAVAGTLTIIVDTIGFCGRFFAEAIEDSEDAPREALTAGGASRLQVLVGAILPDAAPSMVNAALFSLEMAVRSSVVLGLVGAGGIGQELKVAFDLFQYQSAATIIIAIFCIVLAMEVITDRLRRRLR
ncbi:phosphonate ABC transporter, permease protein PhnE [Pontivivens ytuae]|uniref:Phosphonate ABC transporter, permease protein PhnE n=1 Tax=Pontivivens ytuae TaxID=2789856 RepID=A0A7S9LQ37_9RHOB|nr:phosphonate ABC transporter, permease protein PhnE [Pontivivens ytuae]QPH53214.1 phosphonate ABC transporter, permease protein PhnE [Pontivivens ytuae]